MNISGNFINFLMKKLEEVITKWTKIGHLVRVFGEFKIVESLILWGLRFSASFGGLILLVFVVAGQLFEFDCSFCCQPGLAYSGRW